MRLQSYEIVHSVLPVLRFPETVHSVLPVLRLHETVHRVLPVLLEGVFEIIHEGIKWVP